MVIELKSWPDDRRRRQAATSVVVVSRQRAFAEALAVGMEAAGGLAANVASGFDAADVGRPDVVLVDLDGWTSGALALVEDLGPTGTHMVVTATSARDEDWVRALNAGVIGFVSKASSLAEVVRCVQSAANDQAVVPAELAATLFSRRRHAQSHTPSLTPRELEILRMCAQGLSTAAVAEALVISVNTVRTHVQNALTKLGARNRLEAVAKATRCGLLERPTP